MILRPWFWMALVIAALLALTFVGQIVDPPADMVTKRVTSK